MNTVAIEREMNKQVSEQTTTYYRNHAFTKSMKALSKQADTNKKEKQKYSLGIKFVPSQAFVLHVCCDSPTHPLPPFLGSGLVQVLIRFPPPQVLEHPLKTEKPPCTGTNTSEGAHS